MSEAGGACSFRGAPPGVGQSCWNLIFAEGCYFQEGGQVCSQLPFEFRWNAGVAQPYLGTDKKCRQVRWVAELLRDFRVLVGDSSVEFQEH